MSTPTPPERCPVCDGVALTDYKYTNGLPMQRGYICGATWKPTVGENNTNWFRLCKFVMTAALRTGATLTPSPREVARDALVESSAKMVKALERFNRSIDWVELDDEHDQDAAINDLHMTAVVFEGDYAAYRATLDAAA